MEHGHQVGHNGHRTIAANTYGGGVVPMGVAPLYGYLKVIITVLGGVVPMVFLFLWSGMGGALWLAGWCRWAVSLRVWSATIQAVVNAAALLPVFAGSFVEVSANLVIGYWPGLSWNLVKGHM